jgi:uncharacterized SAM-binding protein YcdF (DUF218 family)
MYRRLLVGAVAALLLLCAATSRLIVWPASGMPAHVSAIVMLAGPGARLSMALRLANERRASFLAISRGHDGYGGPCPARVRRVRLICFDPVPASTRGEAEVVGRLARTHHWRSLVLVTNTAQDSRARERMKRCFPGHVYVVTVPVPLASWPGQIAYEWAATLKMWLIQPGC